MTNDSQKLQDIQAQIDALKTKHAPVHPKNGTADSQAMSQGMRAGTELVGAIGGGALIGYGLDRWLDTKPWFLLVFLILGIFTAFLNIWKTTQNSASATGYKNIPNTQNKSLANDDEPLK